LGGKSEVGLVRTAPAGMADQQRPSATKRMLAMMPELAAWETPSGPCGATASVLSNHVSTDLRLFVDEATPRDEEHRSESPYEASPTQLQDAHQWQVLA
jgi:hypothetical protein